MELIAGATPPMAMMIDRLQPLMVPPLFDAEGARRLRALAGALAPARYLLFEHHLGGGAARTDLSIGKLAAIPAGLSAPAWLEHDGPVLLEYDLHDRPTLGGIFATFSPRVPATEASLRTLVEGVPGDRPASVQRVLARAAAAQVAGESWITHLGLMLGRPGQPVRINVGFHEPEALRAYVAMLEPDAQAGASLETLLRLCDTIGAFRIAALDLVDGLAPRVGIEFHVPTDAGTWQALASSLVDDGLCTPEEAAAICRWPARDASDAAAWPEPFRSLDQLMAPQPGGRLIRSINHLKLVAEGDGTIQAKIYLAATYFREDGIARSERAA